MNLNEDSKSYYEEAEVYKKFSEAEDFPDLIYSCIQEDFRDKVVLDLGCGNGKYTDKIKEIAKLTVGIDKSFQQLKLSNENILVNADCMLLPFKNESFDVVFASWVLGTIKIEKLKIALTEIKRVLKKNGKILLIENDVNSEFEKIRGRTYPDDRTVKYNEALLNLDFEVKNKINTFFKFENKEISNNVFKSIWGNIIDSNLNEVIEHKVIIFEFDNSEEKCKIENGCKYWYKNGVYHKTGDEPALTNITGDMFWYKNGILHRDNNKPAIIKTDGGKQWWVNGLKHNLNGPAIISFQGLTNKTEEWWVNGLRHRLDGPAIEYKNGDKEWWVNGLRHRLDGPAITNKNGHNEWWVNGKKISLEDFNVLMLKTKFEKDLTKCDKKNKLNI